jgi:uncharacterized membrane protein YoaK (UPF0700 family)
MYVNGGTLELVIRFILLAVSAFFAVRCAEHLRKKYREGIICILLTAAIVLLWFLLICVDVWWAVTMSQILVILAYMVYAALLHLQKKERGRFSIVGKHS